MKYVNSGKSYYDIHQMFEYGKVTTEYAMHRVRENIGSLKKQEEIVPNYLDERIQELDQFIGLTNIKSLTKEVQAFINIQEARKKEDLATNPLVLHMIFKGNPGTGKTTVARLLGEIFYEMGVLEKGHLVEVERADLVGEYIGHTAVKVRNHMEKSLGGILFIDEAYSLGRGGERDFGKEAIDALVKGMEDYKEKLILILAGYRDEMEEFLKINPGLKSRFPIQIEFPDYSLEELVKIAEVMVKNRQYELSLSSKAKLSKIISQRRIKEGKNSGNGRLVRNIIERAMRKQAVRLQKSGIHSREDLIILRKEDIEDLKDLY